MPKVAEIMERDPVTVTPEDTVETVLRTLRDHELPGVPVVNAGGRPVGIVTEADLVMVDEEEDLRLPLHIDLFGAQIFLGPVKRFEERFRKAIATTAEEIMTPDPVTVDADADVREAARLIARAHAQPPAGRRARPAGRRRHPSRRAGSARHAKREPARALARVNLAAIERNCALLNERIGDGTALCAVVKANAYGHGAVPAARAAQAGGASWLAVAAAREAAELRAGGIDGRLLVLGAISGEELPVRRSTPRRTSSPGASRSSRAGGARRRRAGGRSASTSSSTSAWAGSARAIPRRCWRSAARCWRRRAWSWSAAMIHFPMRRRGRRADAARAGRASSPSARACASCVPGGDAARRQQPGGALPAGEPARHGPLRDRRLRARPVAARPGRRTGSSRRWSCAPTSPR